jgi:glycine cleavage system aminomethyltransferase T
LTREVLIDASGRRSYITSAAYGPSIGEQITMGYLPIEFAREGESVLVEYFGEHFPMTVRSTSARGLYDPDNTRVKS